LPVDRRNLLTRVRFPPFNLKPAVISGFYFSQHFFCRQLKMWHVIVALVKKVNHMQPVTNTTDKPNGTEELLQAGKENPANGVPAHEAAEADMMQDPDLDDKPEKGNELDEGELAQMEGEE
jgi:hypothetical protein